MSKHILQVSAAWRYAILIVVFSAFVACSELAEIPLQEIRAQEINKVVMCPVCPGESIDQSQHPLAVQMRAIVDDKLEQGWNETQILNYFVERYGPSVLLTPPSRGFDLTVWVVPPAVVAIGIALLYFSLRMMTRKRRLQPQAIAMPRQVSAAEREYLNRVEAALAEDAGDSMVGGDTSAAMSESEATP